MLLYIQKPNSTLTNLIRVWYKIHLFLPAEWKASVLWKTVHHQPRCHCDNKQKSRYLWRISTVEFLHTSQRGKSSQEQIPVLSWTTARSWEWRRPLSRLLDNCLVEKQNKKMMYNFLIVYNCNWTLSVCFYLMAPSFWYSSWMRFSERISRLVLRFLLQEHVSLKLNTSEVSDIRKHLIVIILTVLHAVLNLS